MRRVKLNQTDRLIYNREIEPYLPEKIFDAHAHTLINEFYVNLEKHSPSTLEPLLRDVDVPYLEHWWQTLFPGKTVNGLILGFPAKDCNIHKINQHLSSDVIPPNRFSILVHPKTSAKELDEQIQRYNPAGLKPYMVFTDMIDCQQAAITDMITTEQLDVANNHGLCVTLHVSKPHGMADEQNLNDISQLIRDFSNCNFILAHCGRCFLSCFMEEALNRLPVAENLWIDTSAVCDLGVFVNLLTRYDRSRILFGTDLVTASGFRGKYVTMGYTWDACRQEAMSNSVNLSKAVTLAVYENLRVFIQAIRFCKLKKTEIKKLFSDNAVSLLWTD